MHFHLPKPVHGWRDFFGEVGIIVLGVLIALGAEQLVETLRWKSEVREFRTSVDRELALNLDVFKNTMRNRDCVARRLDELQGWIAASGQGRNLPLAGPVGEPTYRSQYRSVWENKDGAVTAHLPMETRLRYAEIYDEFENTSSVMAREREVWRDLGAASLGEPLDHQDRMRFYGLIVRARALNDAMMVNYPFEVELGRKLGVKPEGAPALDPSKAEMQLCAPLVSAS
jgi:hypothetical protein